MIEKKIVVPEGMLKAARKRFSEAIRLCSGSIPDIESSLEAACRWLSENPIVPTNHQIGQMRRACDLPVFAHQGFERICVEWQRGMFLALEPRIPEEIKDLIREQTLPTGQWYTIGVDVHNQAILEAFRRGQKAGPQ